MERHHAFDEMEWTAVDELLDKKVVHGERMSVTHYRFRPGGRFPNHVHPQEQITFCMRGAVTFTVEEEAVTITAGELVVIPPHVPHAARAMEEGALVLSMVSPGRGGADGDGIVLLEDAEGGQASG